jgi:hypothetical protein
MSLFPVLQTNLKYFATDKLENCSTLHKIREDL